MIVLYKNRKAEEQFSSVYKKKWRYSVDLHGNKDREGNGGVKSL